MNPPYGPPYDPSDTALALVSAIGPFLLLLGGLGLTALGIFRFFEAVGRACVDEGATHRRAGPDVDSPDRDPHAGQIAPNWRRYRGTWHDAAGGACDPPSSGWPPACGARSPIAGMGCPMGEDAPCGRGVSCGPRCRAATQVMRGRAGERTGSRTSRPALRSWPGGLSPVVVRAGAFAGVSVRVVGESREVPGWWFVRVDGASMGWGGVVTALPIEWLTMDEQWTPGGNPLTADGISG